MEVERERDDGETAEKWTDVVFPVFVKALTCVRKSALNREHEAAESQVYL